MLKVVRAILSGPLVLLCAWPVIAQQFVPCEQPAHIEPNNEAGGVADVVPADPIDETLQRLEAGAADLKAFTATIYYETYNDLLDRREIRTGEIIYRIQRSEDVARDITSFAVLFDALTIGQRRSERLKHYVFHDRWLAEIDHETRQFIKRELVPPGRQLDPLKLGEGPIPLPIGQAKSEVQARFDVSLHPLPDEGPLARLENVDGLLLIPKAGTPEAQDYQRIELFYDRDTNLPIGINAIELNENRKTVRLSNVQRNPDLTDEQLSKLSVEEPDPRQWSINVQPYRTGS
jgi:hypothetical protein